MRPSERATRINIAISRKSIRCQALHSNPSLPRTPCMIQPTLILNQKIWRQSRYSHSICAFLFLFFTGGKQGFKNICVIKFIGHGAGLDRDSFVFGARRLRDLDFRWCDVGQGGRILLVGDRSDLFGWDEVPINHSIVTITLCQPIVAFLEMAIAELNRYQHGWTAHIIPHPSGLTHKSGIGTVWTGMLRDEHAVFLPVDLRNAHLGGFAPGQEHHPVVSHAIHETDGFLGEILPALVGVTRRLVRSHREGRVEH